MAELKGSTVPTVVEEDYRVLGHLSSIYGEDIRVREKTFHPDTYRSYIQKKLDKDEIEKIKANFSDDEGKQMIYSFLFINGGSTKAYEKLREILKDEDPRAELGGTLQLYERRGIIVENLMAEREASTRYTMEEVVVKGEAPPVQTAEETPREITLGKWNISFGKKEGQIKEIGNTEKPGKMEEFTITAKDNKKYYLTLRYDKPNEIRILDGERNYWTLLRAENSSLIPDNMKAVPDVLKDMTISDGKVSAHYMERKVEMAAGPTVSAKELKKEISPYVSRFTDNWDISVRGPTNVTYTSVVELRITNKKTKEISYVSGSELDSRGIRDKVRELEKDNKVEIFRGWEVRNEKNEPSYILGNEKTGTVCMLDGARRETATLRITNQRLELQTGKIDKNLVKEMKITDRNKNDAIVAEYRQREAQPKVAMKE
jgi:hypothetical protein